VVILAAALCGSACGGVGPVSVGAQPTGTDVPLVTLAKGALSAIAERRLIAVRNQLEWQELWRAHQGGGQSGAPLPPVDFEKDMVLAMFAGEKGMAGHAIEIRKLEAAPGELRVFYAETRPPPGAMVAQMVTQPYHIARSQRFDGPVTFTPLTQP